MPRLLMSLTLAAALAVSPLAARSVQAQDADEVVGLIAGLAAIAIIGAAINDNRNDKARQSTRPSKAQIYDGRGYGWSHGRTDFSRERWHNRSWRDLPAVCRRTFETPRGERTVFGARCLDRNYDFVRFLPERCERQVRTNRGLRPAYGARCLRQEGFRVEARTHSSR